MTDLNVDKLTPPPELVQQWLTDGRHQDYCATREYAIAQAANWGWDQRDATVPAQLQQARDEELEACCKWLEKVGPSGIQLWGDDLRTERRPKPPTLKEQALAELNRLIALIPTEGALAMAEPIRAALEALPND